MNILVISCNYHMRNIYAVKFLNIDSVVTLFHLFHELIIATLYPSSTITAEETAVHNRTAGVVYSLHPRTTALPDELNYTGFLSQHKLSLSCVY